VCRSLRKILYKKSTGSSPVFFAAFMIMNSVLTTAYRPLNIIIITIILFFLCYNHLSQSSHLLWVHVISTFVLLTASSLYPTTALVKRIRTFVIDQYSDPYGRIAAPIILYTLCNLNCFTLYSPPTSVDVKKKWIYISTPPIHLHGVVLN
jgi:hypothetical protein